MAGTLHLQRHWLQQHPTQWDPNSVHVTLSLAVDGCIVPSAGAPGNARVDSAHLVVLDGFFDERVRASLMAFLTERDWGGDEPPSSKWERATCDQAFLPKTWGLKDEVLQEFAHSQLWGKLEVQSRLCKLYPEVDIAHMPSDSIQTRAQPVPEPSHSQQLSEHMAADPSGAHIDHQSNQQQQQQQQQSLQQEHEQYHAVGLQLPQSEQPESHQEGQHANSSHQRPVEHEYEAGEDTCNGNGGGEGEQEAAVDCNQFVANAAVYGDCFAWHVDADPWTFPPSPWTDQYGQYVNREPGKPLFVSLLLYLDEEWPREWDAETLFLDTQSDTGIIVRPKKYRAILMDQDMLHRLSTPSQLAQRPRYSLVWKLLFLPRTPAQACSITRPEWGRPTHFGSAAKVEQVVKQLAGRKRPLPQEQHVGS